MWVYGDAEAQVAPRSGLAAVATALAALATEPPGLERHAALVRAFIDLAGLAQGCIDAEATRLGHDALSASQAQLLDALRQVARAVDRSWQSDFDDQAPVHAPVLALGDLAWPEIVTVKRCEGYAFYALYPESYLEAARRLPADSVVVGLRSIGTGLAALVAATAGTQTLFTLRPSGPPFAREINAGAELEAAVRGWSDRTFAIADEGPGLSGSSFGGTADWLEGLGVAPERIVFMPSHGGELGDEASEAHRQRWAQANRRVCDFDALFLAPNTRYPLAGWFADMTGVLAEPPVDLSGGRWATARPDLPTSPGREARKYLLSARNGRFLARFVGIDAIAQTKLARARQLHAAGFGPEPLALRHGFLLERYVDAQPADHVPADHLIAYLRFRRDHFPAQRRGASLEQLLVMAVHNLRQVAPDAAARLASRWTADRVRALEVAVMPVQVDARLHRWEWLETGGRLLKTDALDHAEAHDLVGCQDIAWDVAGALTELPEVAGPRLREAFVGPDPARAELLAFLEIAYPAFQLGWWAMAGTPAGTARSHWYADRLIVMLR